MLLNSLNSMEKKQFKDFTPSKTGRGNLMMSGGGVYRIVGDVRASGFSGLKFNASCCFKDDVREFLEFFISDESGGYGHRIINTTLTAVGNLYFCNSGSKLIEFDEYFWKFNGTIERVG